MKVLLYDIESGPLISTTWGLYDQNVVWVIKDWYMLSFAYKWLGERSTHVLALPDFKTYKKDPENDIELVKALHALFEEADVVIAHNGIQFDQRKSNARFIIHGMNPPSPYKAIDTKRVAKRYFNFTSNKLDDLGEYLGVGRKMNTGGYGLWKECLAGNPAAWNKMKRYNKQDVVLLEQIYLKLRPWIDNHPSVSMHDNRPEACPKCGSSNLQSRGNHVNKTTVYKRYQCQGCGGWSKARLCEKVPINVSFVN